MSKKKKQRLLPKGFKSLEKWIGMWVLPDSQARTEQRHQVDYADIEAFYNDMLPKAEKALAYLQKKQLGELDEPEERLLKLMLSLAYFRFVYELEVIDPVVAFVSYMKLKTPKSMFSIVQFGFQDSGW